MNNLVYVCLQVTSKDYKKNQPGEDKDYVEDEIFLNPCKGFTIISIVSQ